MRFYCWILCLCWSIICLPRSICHFMGQTCHFLGATVIEGGDALTLKVNSWFFICNSYKVIFHLGNCVIYRAYPKQNFSSWPNRARTAKSPRDKKMLRKSCTTPRAHDTRRPRVPRDSWIWNRTHPRSRVPAWRRPRTLWPMRGKKVWKFWRMRNLKSKWRCGVLTTRVMVYYAIVWLLYIPLGLNHAISKDVMWCCLVEPGEPKALLTKSKYPVLCFGDRKGNYSHDIRTFYPDANGEHTAPKLYKEAALDACPFVNPALQKRKIDPRERARKRKMGYCECCRMSYANLAEHVKVKHMQFFYFFSCYI